MRKTLIFGHRKPDTDSVMSAIALSYLENVLEDYTYELDGQKLSYGEKRIYAPNFIYISKGKAIRMTTGISEKQQDSREKLTKEILKDEEQKFDDFFISACDDSC